MIVVHSRNDEGLNKIKIHQNDLVPIDAVEKSKSWLEYKFDDKNPRQSKFRCRICHEHYDSFGLEKRYKSSFASESGTIKSNKKENRKAILEHPKSPGHMNIIDILEKREAKRLNSKIHSFAYSFFPN